MRTTSVFAAGRPGLLFMGTCILAAAARPYDVTPDGLRFPMMESGEYPAQPVTRIHGVLNWVEQLKRRVPVK